MSAPSLASTINLHVNSRQATGEMWCVVLRFRDDDPDDGCYEISQHDQFVSVTAVGTDLVRIRFTTRYGIVTDDIRPVEQLIVAAFQHPDEPATAEFDQACEPVITTVDA